MGLPPAKIVADRFHLAKLYRAAVDAWRKIEMKELKAILTKEEYARLKGVLGALQKRHENLEPEEQALLDGLFEASPLLRKTYNLREKLTRIFDKKHSKKSGRRAIRRWMAAVRESGLDGFDKFLSTLEKRMDTITNYFISRSSSGWVEGLNNKIKVLIGATWWLWGNQAVGAAPDAALSPPQFPGTCTNSFTGEYVINGKNGVVIDSWCFTNPGGRCLVITNSSNITIKNSTFKNCNSVGIAIWDSSNILIENNRLDSIG